METKLDDNVLTFRLKDKVLGEDITLENMSLPILSKFANQVASFLKGNKYLDLSSIKTNIKSGSLVIEAPNNTGLLDDALKDYDLAFTFGSIGQIDQVRATVIEEWQHEVRVNSDRVYEIFKGTFDSNIPNENKIIINDETNFKKPIEVWVPVEKYVYGKINDLGGKKTANVHMEIIGHGTITIGTEAKKLIEDKTNRLYRKQLIRISAEENMSTHALRNEKLISFDNYEPKFDEDEFDTLVNKGTRAWSDIKDTNLWLEEIRGNA